MLTWPYVVVVILSWNQGELTADCLQSLQEQNYANFDIVVVDNGSADGSAAMLKRRFPCIILIENTENLGYSEGNNIGIRHALEKSADYVLLLNNDTCVDPEMLARLVMVAESDAGIGIAGPTMYFADPPDRVWGGENRIDWRRASDNRSSIWGTHRRQPLERETPIPADYIDACAILIKAEVFEQIGLLDARYFINYDDLDFNVRAGRAGYKICYVPAARMWHKVSASMGAASPATTYYMTRNALLFYRRHAPGIWKALAPARIILRTLRTSVAITIRKQYQPDIFRRKRAAHLLALRDFTLGRFGKMGEDVQRICCP